MKWEEKENGAGMKTENIVRKVDILGFVDQGRKGVGGKGK